MRTFTLLLLLVANPLQGFSFQVDSTSTQETILLLIRHAERAEDGTRNPPISAAGIQRAENLANVISANEYNLTSIYSTAYKRTQMTAAPTATLFNLDVMEYGFDDLENWLTELIKSNQGAVVLIVGHSNTTPRLVNMVLGEEKFEQLDEHSYGDLFILTTHSFGSGNVELSSF